MNNERLSVYHTLIDCNIRRSRFSHIYTNDIDFCYYNSLNRKQVFVPLEIHKIIHNLSVFKIRELCENFIDSNYKKLLHYCLALLSAEIYVDQNCQEEKKFFELKQRLLKNKLPNIRLLVLQVTDFCNMACNYCFIEASKGNKSYINRKMSFETAEKSILWFSKIIRLHGNTRLPGIVFYGGEPLTNIEVIEHSLCVIKKLQRNSVLPESLELVIITNGTIVSEKIVDLIKQHNISISVSLDGPPDLHDKYRRFSNGDPTGELILSNIKYFQKNKINPGVSCVVTENNVNNLPAILKWFHDDVGIRAFGINHRSSIGNGFNYNKDFEERYSEELIKSYQVVSDSSDAFERRLSSKIEAFFEDKAIVADCTGCGEQVSISPDGFIGICQGDMGERSTFNHSVYEETAFNPQNDKQFIEWSIRSPFNMEQCTYCPALTICGGGCPNNAKLISGSIWGIDKSFCHHALKTLEWLIWESYATKGEQGVSHGLAEARR